MRSTQCSRSYLLLHCRKTRIEAAIETHLQFDPGFFDFGERVPDHFRIERNRLLTEDMLARLGTFDHLRGVLRRGRADQNGINFRVIEDHAMVVSRDRDTPGGSPGLIQKRISDRL